MGVVGPHGGQSGQNPDCEPGGFFVAILKIIRAKKKMRLVANMAMRGNGSRAIVTKERITLINARSHPFS